MQILVVGGGIQGLASAAALAREGHQVQLLERERPGQRASWVAAGLLMPSGPWKYPSCLVELCHASEALYPAFVQELFEHTGLDSQLETGGMLYPAGFGYDAAEIAEHQRMLTGLGYGVEQVGREQLDELAPGFGPMVTGAAWQREVSWVRPPRLLAALIRRAEQLGVSILSECDVVGLVERGGRIVGARLLSGQVMEAELVVLAAGSWSGGLARSVDLTLDVRPVRGQILLLRGPPGLLSRTIDDRHTYLVPRRDGRILVGSTLEDAGFDAITTPQALERLRRDAAALFPPTADMRVETDWAGLRPGTADRRPYIGAVPELPGLVLATGHYRNGVLLAPITARLVTDVVAGRDSLMDLEPFAPRPVDPDLELLIT